MLANRKTKIICTIGPASESKEMMTKLVENGMNIIRLNFSHGDFEEHGNRIRNIREVVKETGKNIAILLDTKGPEVRENLRTAWKRMRRAIWLPSFVKKY